MELSQFAVYWDFNFESFASLSQDDFQAHFLSFIDKAAVLDPPKHYFLKPVSGYSKVILNTDLLNGNPGLLVDVLFESVAIRVSEDHLTCIKGLWAAFKLYMRAEKHRPYRPQVIVHQSPKAWWKFAIGRLASRTNMISPGSCHILLLPFSCRVLAHIKERNRRRTWAFLSGRRAERIKYIAAYAVFLKSKYAKGTAAELTKLQTELKILERNLEFEDIRFYRYQAEVKVTQQLRGSPAFFLSLSPPELLFTRLVHLRLASPSQTPSSPAQQAPGWLSSWWTSTASSPGATDAGVPLTAENLQQLQDLVEYGDSQEVAQQHSYPKDKDYISTKFHFLMDTCTLELLPKIKSAHRESETGSTLLGLLSSFTLNYERKPNVDGYTLLTILQKFEVTDTRRQSPLFPFIVSPKSLSPAVTQLPSPEEPQNASPFFSLLYEKKPTSSLGDTKVTCFMQPLDIVFNRELVDQMLEIFWEQSNDPLVDTLRSVALDQLESLKLETARRFDNVLNSREVLDLDLDLHAPRIIVPLDVSPRDPAIMVFDLGRFRFRNEKDLAVHPLKMSDTEGLRFLAAAQPGLPDDAESEQDVFFDVSSELPAEGPTDVAHEFPPPPDPSNYDNYVMTLSSMEALSTRLSQDWRNPEVQKRDRLNIVEEFSLSLNFRVKRSSLDDALPLVHISGSLPELSLVLSRAKFNGLLKFADALDLPENPKEDLEPSSSAVLHDEPSVLEQEASNRHFLQEDLALGNLQAGKEEDKVTAAALAASQLIVQLEFAISRAKVTLLKHDQTNRVAAFATATMETVVAQFVKRPQKSLVAVSLHSFVLHDHNQPENCAQMIFAKVRKGENAIMVTFAIVEPQIANFETKYFGARKHLGITVSRVDALFNRETILNMLFIIEEEEETHLKNGKKGAEAEPAHPTQQSTPALDPNNRMRISFECETLAVTLNRRALKFAKLEISKMTLGIVTASLNDPKMTLIFAIYRIACEDLLARSKKWAMIARSAGSEGEQLVNFRLTTYQTDTPIYPGHEFDISLAVGRMDFVYLNRCVMSIVDFFMELVDMRTVIFSEHEFSVMGGDFGVLLADQGTKVQLKISVDSPIILVPRNSTSDQVTRLSASALTVKTTPAASLTSLQVDVTSIQVTSKVARLGDAPLVQAVDVSLALHPMTPAQPARVGTRESLAVEVSVTPLDFMLSHQLFEALMGLIDENLPEKDSLPPLVGTAEQTLEMAVIKRRTEEALTSYMAYHVSVAFPRVSVTAVEVSGDDQDPRTSLTRIASISFQGILLGLLWEGTRMEWTLSQQSFVVEDHLQPDGEAFSLLASSSLRGDDHALLRLSYVSWEPQSSRATVAEDGKDAYGTLQITLSNLTFNLNPQTLTRLVKVFDLPAKGEAETQPAAPQITLETTAFKEVELHKLKVTLDVRSLHLLVHHGVTKMADFSMTNAGLRYISRTDNLTFSLDFSLGSASVLDLSPQAGRHATPITVMGENKMFEFSLNKVRPVGDLDSEFVISAIMRSVRIVYLQRFVDEAIWFLEGLDSPAPGEETGVGRLGKPASLPQTQAKTKATYTVEFINPILVLPLGANEDSVFEASLGKLTVANSFVRVGDPGAMVVLPFSFTPLFRKRQL